MNTKQKHFHMNNDNMTKTFSEADIYSHFY